jgi:hypothetical protein
VSALARDKQLLKAPTHVMTPGAPGVDPAHLIIDGKKVAHADVAGILAQQRRERMEVQHPGVKGGKWHRTPDGRIRYGKAPEGQQHEPIAQLGTEHLLPGHRLMYETASGQHHGHVLNTNKIFATVAKDDGETHAAVPYHLMRSVDPPLRRSPEVDHLCSAEVTQARNSLRRVDQERDQEPPRSSATDTREHVRTRKRRGPRLG